ncbi:MAG: hydroxymethylglutaryl-CoA reductase, partial [Candidatus Micrarchaeaceae archaeon]
MAESNMRSVNAGASKSARIAKKVLSGELSLRQIDEHAGPNEAVEIRREAIARLANVKLSNLGSAKMDYSIIHGKNAENVIGMITVPVGVVGPLKINRRDSKEEVFVPMATTEGALIASISRGVKAINRSGGATVRVIEDGMARGPVFAFNSIVDIERFLSWLPRNEGKIKEVAEGTTNHGRLKDIKPIVSGNNVFLRFKYYTGDAMGMNMATVATEAACSYIEEKFKGARLIAVSGNVCSDKKPSLINAIEGRGKTVVAEALVPEEVLKSTFKTTAEAVHELNYIKNWVGSASAGSATHFNANFENSVAA